MEKEIEDVVEINDGDKCCAYNPEDGIVLEWWGRAEGIDDSQ